MAYGEQNQVAAFHLAFQEDLIRVSKAFDLRNSCRRSIGRKPFSICPSRHHEGCGWAARDLRRHMPVDTARNDERAPNDLLVQGAVARQHEDQRAGLLVHVLVRRLGGPNLAAYNHVRRPPGPRSPTSNTRSSRRPPCSYKRVTENTIVGERSVGDLV